MCEREAEQAELLKRIDELKIKGPYARAFLNELALLCRDTADFNGFLWELKILDPDKGDYVVPTMLMLIVTEVSEATEAWRDDKPLDEELADIIIRVLDLADELHMNIHKAVFDKMQKNIMREPKHGRKRF